MGLCYYSLLVEKWNWTNFIFWLCATSQSVTFCADSSSVFVSSSGKKSLPLRLCLSGARSSSSLRSVSVWTVDRTEHKEVVQKSISPIISPLHSGWLPVCLLSGGSGQWTKAVVGAALWKEKMGRSGASTHLYIYTENLHSNSDDDGGGGGED